MKYTADEYQKSLVCSKKYYNNPKIQKMLTTASRVLYSGNIFAVVLSYILAKNGTGMFENIALSFAVAICADVIFFGIRHYINRNLYVSIIEREKESIEILNNRLIYRFHSTYDDKWYRFDCIYSDIQEAYNNSQTSEIIFYGEIPAIRGDNEADLDTPDKCEQKIYPAISIFDYFNAELYSKIKNKIN